MTTPERQDPAVERGYGNIYTPSAGAMIIHVQRESGLANRTVVFTSRQVRLLRVGLAVGAVLLGLGVASWFFLAAQAARVPILTSRVSALQHDVQRLDTLQVALAELEGRYKQMQQMLGATASLPALAPSGGAGGAASADSSAPPTDWRMPLTGPVLAPSDGPARPGIALAAAANTAVRAASAGMVVEVSSSADDGIRIRIAHRGGFESIYANLSEARVAKGERVAAGTLIGSSGGPAHSLPAHLRFMVRRGGADVDPTTLVSR